MVLLYQNGKPRMDIIHEYELTPSALDRWIVQSQMKNDILKQAALILGRK